MSVRCEEILAALPVDFRLGEIQDGEPRNPSAAAGTGGMQPLNIFLKQELCVVQDILDVVKGDIGMLQMAMAGNMVMNDALNESSDAIFVLDVPQLWLSKSFAAPGLMSWVQELCSRIDQLRKWLHEGRPPMYMLGKFFNPNGLLTAVMQEMAQKNSWELDGIQLCTEVTSLTQKVGSGPAQGIYVGGLFLEAATFDTQQQMLVECSLDDRALLSQMPLVHVSAVSSGGVSHDSRLYSCPVYQSPARRLKNYIFSVDLRSEEAVPDKWILAGVCITCSQ